MRWYKSRHKFRRLVPWIVFLAVVAAVLCLHRCSVRPLPAPQPLQPAKASISTSVPAVTIDTVTPSASMATPAEKPKSTDIKGMRATLTVAPPAVPTSPPTEAASGPDTLPYVYAAPWGGRHFDSVTVTLHCQEGCEILYSLEDSTDLREYTSPLTFQKNATLWFSGVSKRGNRTPPLRLDYVIEKKPNPCAAGMVPVPVSSSASSKGDSNVCVDVYEWPNREGANPTAMVSQEGAEDSCASRGKHLCSLDEWRAACEGPGQSSYPYGETYDERYCPAQQSDPS